MKTESTSIYFEERTKRAKEHRITLRMMDCLVEAAHPTQFIKAYSGLNEVIDARTGKEVESLQRFSDTTLKALQARDFLKISRMEIAGELIPVYAPKCGIDGLAKAERALRKKEERR